MEQAIVRIEFDREWLEDKGLHLECEVAELLDNEELKVYVVSVEEI